MYKKLLILFVFVVGILFTQNVFGAPYIPPPAPTVNISASPTSVSYNGSSTLTWSSTNARSCTASGSWSGTKAISGFSSVTPSTVSSTYSITCTGAGGSITKSATVNIITNPGSNCSCYNLGQFGNCWALDNGSTCFVGVSTTDCNQISPMEEKPYCAGAVPVPVPVPPPITVNFSANPISVNFNGSSILSWSSTGTTSCVGTNFNTSGATSNPVGVSTGALTALKNYTITCFKADACLSMWGDIPLYSSNVSGTYLGTAVQWCAGKTNQTACNNASASPGGADPVQPICKWVPGPTPVSKTATVVVVIPPPTVSLTADKTKIVSGDPLGIKLTWNSTNATSCSTLGTVTNSFTTVFPTISKDYTQKCSGSGGETTSNTVSITVTAPMSGSLSSPDCTIASGVSSCNATVSWSITNPQTTPTAITASGMSDINVTPPSGTQSVTVSYPSRTFYLYNNGQLLAQDLQQASCVSGTSWDGAKCAPPLPPMSGTLTGPSSCIITLGNKDCSINLSWSITNPEGNATALTWSGGASTVSNSKTPSFQSGTQSVTVPYSGRIFYLYNNGKELSNKPASASCGSNVWNGLFCSPPPSGTLSSTSCTIAIGGTSCPSTVSWGVLNPTFFANTEVKREPPYSTISTDQSGTRIENINYGDTNFNLYYNGFLLRGPVSAKASCPANTTWNGTCASNTYTLTINKVGTGSGTVTGAGTYNYNTSVTASGTPNTSSTGPTWSGDCNSNGQVTMTSNKTCTANFTLKTFTLSYSAGTGGTISGTTTQTVSYGGNGTAVTAVPNGSYSFSGWSDGISTATRNDTNVTANKSATANFTLSPVNGVCSATHYNCTAGTSASNSVGYSGLNTNYSWSCVGLNGGTNATNCSETKVMSGTISATNCTITSGNSSCNATVTWNTINPQGTSAVTANGMTNVNGNSGSQSMSVPFSSRTFYLYNSNNLLAQATASASCASGTEWNSSSGKCLPTIPISVSISASPQSMNLPANSTTLSWNTTGSPTSCTATGNWSGAKAVLGGSENKTGLTAGNYTYTITCSKSKAPDAVASVTVTVGAKLICTPPTTETRNTTSCPVGQTGTITETRTKSAYPGCAWGSWTVTSNTCTLIPVMSGTLTPSSPSCEITAGNNSCYIPFSWNVINPQNPGGSAITRNPIIAVGDSGNNVPFSVEYNYGNGRTFYLYNNGVEPPLAQSTVYSDCISGTSWNTNGSNTCVTNPLPSPTANISVNPTSTTSGGAITITWSSTNALSCTGTGFDTGGLTSGSVVVYPTINTTYSVRCDGVSAYATGSASVTISSTGKKPKFKEN